jgi:GxxExxY protein
VDGFQFWDNLRNLRFTFLHARRTGDTDMELNDITHAIIGAAMKVHRTLGPGLLESAYEACLAYELAKQGFQVERQKPVPVVYEEVKLDCGFRADLLLNGLVASE